MPIKGPIGLTKCPECDFVDAQVKEDRNGKPYRYCPDCNAQFFPRSPEGQKRLREKMRAIGSSSPEPASPPAASPPAPSPDPAKPPKKPGALTGLFSGTKEPT